MYKCHVPILCVPQADFSPRLAITIPADRNHIFLVMLNTRVVDRRLFIDLRPDVSSHVFAICDRRCRSPCTGDSDCIMVQSNGASGFSLAPP